MYLSRAGLFLLFFQVTFLFSQTVKQQTLGSPFAKGSYWFDAGNNLWFDQDKVKNQGGENGKENSYGLDLGMYYFPVDHFGAGISISTGTDNSKFDSYESKYSSNKVFFNGMYGTTFDNGFNLYAKAGVGFGSDRSKYSTSYYNNDDKYMDFGVNFEVGAPFRLCQSSGFSFTPEFGYKYSQYKADTKTDKYSGIYLQSSFTASLPCSDYSHDCDDMDEYSDGWYDQGSNFVGGFSAFNLEMGNQKSTYPGGEGETVNTKSATSSISLTGEYFRYLIRNLAIGASLDMYTSASNDKDNNSKYHESSWTFSPKVMENIPVEGHLNDAFAFLEAGLGNSKTKSENSYSTTTYSYALKDMSLGFGYNMFFANSFALSPYIDYRWNSSKDKSSDSKTQISGFEGGFTIRHFFKK